MALTVEQAEQAGAVAAALRKANDAIADLDARIAEAIPLVRLSGDRADGSFVRAEITLDVEETAGLYGYLKTVVEAKRDALVEALAGLGELAEEN
ncbi:MAG: hypothetical protein AB7I59_21770 [Geminicoccaceae bacterium]